MVQATVPHRIAHSEACAVLPNSWTRAGSMVYTWRLVKLSRLNCYAQLGQNIRIRGEKREELEEKTRLDRLLSTDLKSFAVWLRGDYVMTSVLS